MSTSRKQVFRLIIEGSSIAACVARTTYFPFSVPSTIVPFGGAPVAEKAPKVTLVRIVLRNILFLQGRHK